MEGISYSEKDTADIAAALACDLRTGAAHPVVFLRGVPGAGKTVFARALIRALTENPDCVVPSPTFTILQTYPFPGGIVSHFDLYRITCPEEIFEIGWDDSLSSGLCLIEWPERLGVYAPRAHMDVCLSPGSSVAGGSDTNLRQIRIVTHG